MYLRSEDEYPEKLWQGDIIDNFPFFDIGEMGELAAGDGIPGSVNFKKIIILSQTCDIQDREHVLVAPIYEIKLDAVSKTLLDDLRNRKRNYFFYLPKLEIVNKDNFEAETIINESFVDFQTIYFVDRNIIEANKNKRVACLSDWGRHHLSFALSGFFGRPIKDKYN